MSPLRGQTSMRTRGGSRIRRAHVHAPARSDRPEGIAAAAMLLVLGDDGEMAGQGISSNGGLGA